MLTAAEGIVNIFLVPKLSVTFLRGMSIKEYIEFHLRSCNYAAPMQLAPPIAKKMHESVY